MEIFLFIFAPTFFISFVVFGIIALHKQKSAGAYQLREINKTTHLLEEAEEFIRIELAKKIAAHSQPQLLVIPKQQIEAVYRKTKITKCPFCHEEGRVTFLCGHCSTAQHYACFKEHGACVICNKQPQVQPVDGNGNGRGGGGGT